MRIKIPVRSRTQVKILLDALRPETNANQMDRSNVTVKGERKSLMLEIQARDTIALRASANAYLRWISSIINILKVIDEEQT